MANTKTPNNSNTYMLAPKPNLMWFENFFIYCSGADKRILYQPKCWSEHPKYISIGACIAFTAIFATVSAGFAIYSIFHNIFAAIIVGLLWGSFIFFLDRLLVSSIRKSFYNAKESKTANEFIRIMIDLGKSIPRILLAIFIGIVIATPLELKIFEKEIQAQMQKEHLDRQIQQYKDREKALKELDKMSDKGSIGSYGDILKVAQNQKEIDEQVANIENKIASIRKKSTLTNKDREDIAVLQRKKSELFKNKKVQTKSINQAQQIDSLKIAEEERIQIQKVENQKEYDKIKKLIQNPNYAHSVDGFLARWQALHNLTGSPHNKATNDAKWIIMLLFIAIEVMPILVKIMAGRGIYDSELERYYTMQDLEDRHFSVNKQIVETAIDSIEKSLYAINQKIQTYVQANPQSQRLLSDINKTVVDIVNKVKTELSKIPTQ